MEIFKSSDKSNLIYTSGQNIDRIVSIYRACIRTGKILVIDIYVATVLMKLSEFAKIPFPSDNYKNLKVIYPYFTSKRLANQNNQKILYQFKKFKITKEEISNQPDKYVIIVRPSMQRDLDYISGVDGGNLIYSMWNGYKSKPATKKFIEYFESRGFTFYDIHTSGHADITTLQKIVEAIKPKKIVPIHTFHANDYNQFFKYPVVITNDGEGVIV